MGHKIDVEYGGTIPTGDYGNIKLMVKAYDIDTDEPVESQIEACAKVAITVIEHLDGALKETVANILLSEGSGPTALKEHLEKTDLELEKLTKTMGKVVAKVGEMHKKIQETAS